MFEEILTNIENNEELTDEAFEIIANASENEIIAEVGEEGHAIIESAWNAEVNDRYEDYKNNH